MYLEVKNYTFFNQWYRRSLGNSYKTFCSAEYPAHSLSHESSHDLLQRAPILWQYSRCSNLTDCSTQRLSPI